MLAPPTRPGVPVVVSFTVETDGRLPDGQALGDAIEQVDADTVGVGRLLHGQLRAPDALRRHARGGRGLARADRGPAANASARSHAELDEASELDEGDPAGLGAEDAALRPLLPHVTVIGGCCGTDERHIAAAAADWAAAAVA